MKMRYLVVGVGTVVALVGWTVLLSSIRGPAVQPMASGATTEESLELWQESQYAATAAAAPYAAFLLPPDPQRVMRAATAGAFTLEQVNTLVEFARHMPELTQSEMRDVVWTQDGIVVTLKMVPTSAEVERDLANLKSELTDLQLNLVMWLGTLIIAGIGVIVASSPRETRSR